MNEVDFVSRLLRPLASESATIHTFNFEDDAATFEAQNTPFIITKDMITEGVHFPHGLCAGDAMRKAVRVNMSDITAKGAVPFLCMTGIMLPHSYQEKEGLQLTKALKKEADHFGFTVAGGDTVSHNGDLSISITAIGLPALSTRPFVPRGGAIPRDLIYVIGTIGDAYLGLQGALDPSCALFQHLPEKHRNYLLSSYHFPVIHAKAAAILAGYANAAMDISDGLLLDASRMASSSRTTLHINTDVTPFSDAAHDALSHNLTSYAALCTGGDDYAILCTVPPKHQHAFEEELQCLSLPFHSIGHVTPFEKDFLSFSGNNRDGCIAAFSKGGGYVHQ